MYPNLKTDAEALAYLNEHVTRCEDEGSAAAHLAALAGAHIELAPEDYRDERQHDKFAVHCVVAMVAIIECASLIGAMWCVSAAPFAAFGTALFISTALFGLWLFTAVEDQL